MEVLLENVPLAQLIAYVALTVSSVTVAAASLLFSYRQNVGWRPLILVTSHGFSSHEDDRFYNATMKLELWNRRKYPLVLRGLSVRFSELEVTACNDGTSHEKGWHPAGPKKLRNYEQRIIEPTSHVEISLAARFPHRTLDDLVDYITIIALLYDPRKGQLLEVRIIHKYQLQYMLWTPKKLRRVHSMLRKWYEMVADTSKW